MPRLRSGRDDRNSGEHGLTTKRDAIAQQSGARRTAPAHCCWQTGATLDWLGRSGVVAHRRPRAGSRSGGRALHCTCGGARTASIASEPAPLPSPSSNRSTTLCAVALGIPSAPISLEPRPRGGGKRYFAEKRSSTMPAARESAQAWEYPRGRRGFSWATAYDGHRRQAICSDDEEIPTAWAGRPRRTASAGSRRAEGRPWSGPEQARTSRVEALGHGWHRRWRC